VNKLLIYVSHLTYKYLNKIIVRCQVKFFANVNRHGIQIYWRALEGILAKTELLGKDNTLPKGLGDIVRLSKKHLTSWINKFSLKLRQKGIKHGVLSQSKRKGRGIDSPKNRLAYGK